MALLLAVAGVYLSPTCTSCDDPLGITFAVANAALFALYIALAHRVATSAPITGIDGLALAMLVAAVIALPIGLADAVPAVTDPVALVAAFGVGHRVVGRSLRVRPAGDGPTGARRRTRSW